MTAAAGDISRFHMWSGTQDRVRLFAHVVLTTAGAVDTTNSVYDDPAIVFLKDGGTTGLYTWVAPKAPKVKTDVFSVYSPAATVGQGYIKAISPTAGTGSVILSTPAGTAAYGASGDYFDVEFVFDTK